MGRLCFKFWSVTRYLVIIIVLLSTLCSTCTQQGETTIEADFVEAGKNMVEIQIEAMGLKDARVLVAMLEVPRIVSCPIIL